MTTLTKNADTTTLASIVRFTAVFLLSSALVVFSEPGTQARKILLFLCLDQGFAPAGPRWCVHAPREYARRWEKGCFGIMEIGGLGRSVSRHRVATCLFVPKE